MTTAEAKRQKAKLDRSAPAKNYRPLRKDKPLPDYNPKRGSEAIIFHQQPQQVVVRLPRSGQGKAPRNGVHIPLHPMSKAAIASRAKVSKHAQGRKFGGGKSKAATERNEVFLASSRLQALYVAAQRAVDRVATATKLGLETRLTNLKQSLLKAGERFYAALGNDRTSGEVEA